ncbi:VENN motif pre-toxin domain-containing protein [[Pasteurella] aerogenes]|nr:VENN motif pre-toxin domain-containing protein [[Pasteurella] aerogenes]
MQITDSEAQKQKTGKTAEETLQSLNRDVANANQKLEKQDLQALQERQEMAQVIGELSQAGINHLVGDKLKEADKKRQEADAIEKENPEKATALRAQAQAIEAEYGLGSNLQMGVRAATAALQGLATGNVNQAAVGAVSPYLNKLIKEQTRNADGSINREANLIAHAVLGAVEAHFTGNNAAAGAVGALTAEAAAPLIMQTLYGTEKPENLTDSQKQNVANLSQIAAGLSGGLVGDSTGSFVAGAEIGKRAVENNLFAQIFSQPNIDWFGKAEGQLKEQEALRLVYEQYPEIMEAIKSGKTVAEILIDFVPVLGEAKAFYEAEGAVDYALAAVSVIPLAGDAVVALKGAKSAYKAAREADLAGDIAEAEYQLDIAKQMIDKVRSQYAEPMGSRYHQMNQPKNPVYQPVRNKADYINGREYSGHALDRMQDRGILPSIIENAIRTGEKKTD